MSQTSVKQSVMVERLDQIIKLLRGPDYKDISSMGLNVLSTEALVLNPPPGGFTIKADPGNTGYVYFRFGNENATSGGGFQGIPLAPGESVTEETGRYSGRISIIAGSATQKVWFIPLLSLKLSKGSISNTYSDGDGQATAALDTIFTRNMMYDQVTATWNRMHSQNGVNAQVSAANATNIATLYIPILHSGLVVELIRSAATWAGNVTIEASLDNFATVVKTVVLALPGGAITTANLILPKAALTYRSLANNADSIMVESIMLYPYIRITVDAQGAGVTTTMTIALK